MRIGSIALRPGKIASVLGATGVLLVLANLAGLLLKYPLGYPSAYGLIRLFDLGAEQNIPSFFSAFQLLAASLLLWLIARTRQQAGDPFSRRWAILSATFLFMAVDEASSIHELFMRPTEELIGNRATGLFYFAWVVPGMAVTVVFADRKSVV